MRSTRPRSKLPEWAPVFLAAFRQLGHAGQAARMANVARNTPYQLKRRSPLFRRLWAKADRARQQDLREEAEAALQG